MTLLVRTEQTLLFGFLVQNRSERPITLLFLGFPRLRYCLFIFFFKIIFLPWSAKKVSKRALDISDQTLALVSTMGFQNKKITFRLRIINIVKYILNFIHTIVFSVFSHQNRNIQCSIKNYKIYCSNIDLY